MAMQPASTGPVALDDLTLYYQPQMASDGSRMASVEALLRLPRIDGAPLGPGAFMDQFADPEALDALDWWVMRRACADALRWPNLGVGINVSAIQFRKPDFAGRFLTLVRGIGTPLERLELEIVEGAYIDDFETALGNISELRRHGVRIAVDDFGTGYSSLAYLLKLPVDKLKIDKSFIDHVDTVRSAAIVHAIIALARALGMKVTAEGVETKEQCRFLRAAGCHYLQGYLFSRAVSVDDITRRLSAEAAANRPPGALTA